MPRTNAATYLRNVGKSVGYSMIKEIKDNTPAMSAFASNHSEAIKSAYSAIRHMDKTVSKISTKVLESQYGEVGKYALKNIKEDLKSGKFYNMERIKDAESSALSSMGMDSDDDFGFEDLANGNPDDFDMDGGESLESMMDLVGKKSSEAVSDAVIRTTEYAVNAQTELARASAEQNKAMYANLHAALGTINENVGKLIEVANGPMTTHFENSQKFFEAETKLSEERNAILKEMLELQRGIYSPKKKTPVDGKITMADIMDSNGMPDLSVYFDAIKKNLDTLSMGTGDIIKTMLTPDMLKTMVASPLQYATDLMAKKIFPNMIKQSMKSLDKTVSGAFASIMAKVMNTDYENGFVNALKGVLGIEDYIKKDIDTSKYEKGAVPFDGITRKSIVEVIPTYLARIESAITRSSERRFDFDTGKFVSVDDIKKMSNRDKKSAMDSANFDVKSYIDKYMKSINFGNAKNKKEVQANIDRILSQSFDTGILFNPNEKHKMASDYKMEGKNLEYQLELIRKMFAAIPKEVVTAYAKNVYEAKGSYSRTMRAKEESGTSIENALWNNSMKGMRYDRSNQINGFDPSQVKMSWLTREGKKQFKTKFGNTREQKSKGSGGSNKKDKSSSDDDAAASPADAKFMFDPDDYDSLENGVVATLMTLNEDDSKNSSKSKNSLANKLQKSSKLGEGVKKFVKGIEYLTKKPTDFLAGIIKKADSSIYNLIFGVEYDEETGEKKSISKAIFDGLKDTFNEFKEWMREYVFDPIKKYFDKEGTLGNKAKKFVQGKYKEFKQSNFGQRFFDTFKRAGNYTKNLTMDSVGKAFGDENEGETYSAVLESLQKGDATNKASGARRINKTGLAVLSEGEMVIPPDLNPLNIDKRTKKENKAKKSFFDSFIPNFGAGKDRFTVLEGGAGKRAQEEASTFTIAEEWNKKMETNLEGAKEEFSKLSRKAQDKIIRALKKYELGKKAGELTKSIGGTLKNAASSVLNRGLEAWDSMKGEQTEDQKARQTEQRESMKLIAKNGMQEIQKYAPEVAAGALLGGGISWATGAIGGPLVGAAVGAGISLLKHSEQFNQVLFGDVGEDGKRHGGLIEKVTSKNISQTIQKYAPSMGKGAILGGISSFILPFGPLAGIMLGSAAGFAKENEDIREKLFGENGLLGKDFDKKVKKALPAMGAGALVGAVTGPFGLFPNLILGSAVGLGATTDKFKDFMFGKEDENGNRHGGLIENAVKNTFKPIVDFTKTTMEDLKKWAEDNIKEPLRQFVDPVRQQFKIMFRSIHEGINGLFKDHLGATMDNMLRDYIFKPIGDFVKTTIGMTLAPVKFIVSAPFKLAGVVGRKMRDKQVRTGQADDMSASERNAWREKRKIHSRNLKPTEFIKNALLHPISTFTDPIGTAKQGIDKAYGQSARIAKQDEGIEAMSEKEVSNLLDMLSMATVSEGGLRTSKDEALARYTEKVRKSGKLESWHVDRVAKVLQPLMESDKLRSPDDPKVLAMTQKAIGVINTFEDDLSEEDRMMFHNEIKTFISSMLEHNQRRHSYQKNKQSLIEEIVKSKSFQEAGLTVDDIKDEDIESLIRRLKKELEYKAVKADGSDFDDAKGTLNKDYAEYMKNKVQNMDSNLDKIAKSLDFLTRPDLSRVDEFKRRLDESPDIDDDKKYRSVKTAIGHYTLKGARTVGGGVKKAARGTKKGASYVSRHVFDSGETLQDIKDKGKEKIIKGAATIHPFPNAAGGGIVGKTGVVAVSEGELIIPPDFSSLSINKRKKDEDKAKKQFVDSIMGYAEGGEVGEDDSNTKKNPSLFDKLRGFVKNKKEGNENTRFEFNNGRPYKYIKDDKGEWILDKSDSETVNSLKADNEDQEQRKTFFSKMTNMTTDMASAIRKAIAGEEDDGKGNIFSFIGKGLGGIASLLTGNGLGKVAAAALGVPTLVGAVSWINEKTGFTENLKQWWESTGKQALSNLGEGFINFITGDGKFDGGGLPSLLQGLGNFWTKGFQVICQDILPAAIKIFVTSLPAMVKGLLSGIGELLKMGVSWIKDVFTGHKSIDKEKITLKGGDDSDTLFKSSGTSTWVEDIKITSGKTMSLKGDLGELSSGETEIKNPDYSFSIGSSSSGGAAGNASIQQYTTTSGKTIDTDDSAVNNHIASQLASGNVVDEKTARQTLQDKAINSLKKSDTNLKDTKGYNEMPEYMKEELYKNFGITRENLSDFITITPPGSTEPVTMTLEEFLTSNEKMFPIVREDGTEEVLSPQDLLDPHNRDLAEQFGIDYDLTHEERRKNTEEAGLSRETTLGGALGTYILKKGLKGKTTSTGMKAFANLVGKTPVLGRTIRLPFDAAAGLSSAAGRVGNFIFSGGKTAAKRAQAAGKHLVTPHQMTKGLGNKTNKLVNFWQKLTGNYEILDDDVYNELLRMGEDGELVNRKRFGLFKTKDYNWQKNLKTAKKNVKKNAKNATKTTTETATESLARQTAKESTESVADSLANVAKERNAKINASTIVDANGNPLSSNADSLTSAAKKNAKSTTSDVAEKALKEEAEKATGKAGKSALKNAGKELVDGESKGFIAKIQKWAIDLSKKFCKDNKVLGFFQDAAKKVGKSKKAVKSALSKLSTFLVDKLVPKFIKNLTKKGAAAISKLAGKLFIPIVGAVFTVGSAVMAFVDGFNNADTIFGFTDEVMEPTIAMKVIAGVVSAATETITQGLVPAEFIVQGIMFLLEFFGVNFDEINEARDESEKVLQEYNLMNDEGVELTLDEYNRRNDWTTKAGNWIKDKAGKAWGGIKSGASWLKDKAGGLVETAKEGLSNAGSWIKDKASGLAEGARDLAGKAVDKAKDAGNWLTGNAFNDDEIRRRFGVSDDYEITLQDRVSTFLGSKIEQLTGKDFTTQIDGAIDRIKTGVKDGLESTNKKLGGLLGLEDDEGNPLSLTEGAKYNIDKTIDGLKQGWDDFRKNTVEFWKNVGEGAREKWDSFREGVTNGLKKADDKLGSLLGLEDENGNPISLTTGAKNAIKNTVESLARGWSDFKKNTKEFWDNIGDKASETLGNIRDGLSQGLQNANNSIGSLFGFENADGEPISFTEGVSQKWDDIRKGFSEGWDNFKKNTKKFWDNIGDSAKEKWDSFREGVGDALSTVNDNLGAMFGMVDENGKAMSLTDGIAHNWDKFRKGLTDTWKNIQDGAKGLWDKVTGWFTEAGEESVAKHQAADPGARGSGIPRQMMFHARGSSQKPKSDSKYANDPTFVSQIDSKYANQKFNVQGDTQKQTIADSGCGPAAAAMVVNGAYGQNELDMKTASKEALRYKVKNGGVNAAYFEDTFSSHGLMTKYYIDGSRKQRNEEISSSLKSGNRVVLMGSDRGNMSKVKSPYGPDDHYIVATRMSPDGKYIWVNDPESKVPEVKYPAANILNNTKMGVAGIAANGSGLLRHISAKGSGVNTKLINRLRRYHGRGKYGPDTVQYKVWDGIRSAGFSETATAAAMGNIQHESGFNPSAIEKGSAAGFGLIQWTDDRRTAIENYAAQKGVSVSDLGLQIEYLIKELKNETKQWMTASTKYGFGSLTRNDWENGDLDTATKAFMCCFERPAYSSSVNHIDRRLQSAREYYEAFTGTEPSGSSPSTGDGSGDSSSGGSILDDILGAFDTIGEIWGLKKKGSSGNSSSGGSVSNASSLQEALVEKMKSVEGQLAYSQSSRNPDNGSGDCSSTVQWAYQNVLGVDPGSWTGAQETDSDTYTVTSSFDESQMQPGDLILYNGHVEMYAGDGKMIGHGGGNNGTTPGPTVKPLSDQGRFRMIRRWTGFRDGFGANQIPEQYRSLAAKGSGISRFRSNRAIDPKKILKIDNTYKSSNQKMTQDNGFVRRSRYTTGMTKDIKIPAGMYAAGTGIDGYSVQGKVPTGIPRTTTSSSSVNGEIKVRSTGDKVQAYLAAMLKLLAKEVENTTMLSTIVTILTELVKISEEERELRGKTNTEQKQQELNTRRTSILNILKSTGIAKGSDPELEKLISEAQRIAAI